MDIGLQKGLIFLGVAVLGMLGHYIKSWTKGEISGNLIDYLFRDNPRNTVASFSGVFGAAATAYFTGTLTGLDLQALIPFAFTTGFGFDSALNKGGVADPSPAQRAVDNVAKAKAQGGFTNSTLLLVLFLGSSIAVMLSGCAATGGTPPVNAPNKPGEVVAAARVVVTAGVSTADTLYLSGKITKAQGQQVLQAANTVKTLLDLADSYTMTGDTASAQMLLSGPQYTNAFGVLTAFLSAHPATP